MSRERMYTPLSVFKSKGIFDTKPYQASIHYHNLLPKSLQDGELYLATNDTVSKSELVRIAYYHKRSHEIVAADTEGLSETFMRDEFGNMFSRRISQKGADFTNPHLFESSVSSWGYDIHGLQVGGAIPRAIRASEVMRREGIDTEITIGATKLTDFYMDGEVLDQETFYQSLVDKLDVDDTERQRVMQELRKRQTYVTYRLMAVQERFGDVFSPKTKKDLALLRKNILTAVNAYEEGKAQHVPNYIPEQFDPEDDRDVKRYITSYIPKNIGNNFGRMHGIGLYHQYPHLMNISALGGIIDLDSVHGEALGFANEASITPDTIINDVDRILSDFSDDICKEGTEANIRYKHIDASSNETFRRNLIHSYFSSLLETKRFSYKFIGVYHRYKVDLLSADEINNTAIAEQIEVLIQEKYGDHLPQARDILPEDVLSQQSEGKWEGPDEVTKQKNTVLHMEALAYVIRAMIRDPQDSPTDGELYKHYHDLLSMHGVELLKDITTKHLPEYVYAAFSRALHDQQLALMLLPYLDSFEDILKVTDNHKGKNLVGELHNVYGHIMPTAETQEGIWEYLLERERMFQDEQLATVLSHAADPSSFLSLTADDSDYLKKFYDVLLSRLAGWASDDYDKRMQKDEDPETEERQKNNYVYFIMNYMTIKLGTEKFEELKAYARTYATGLLSE